MFFMLTIRQIFDLAVKMGMAVDPRGAKGVKKYLERAKKTYEDMKPDEKEYFKLNSLVNPYSDSGVHVGDEKTPVKRVLAGIDIGSAEVILASQLNERGKTVDLIIGHHPLGRSLVSLHGVMDIQIEIYARHGVPMHTAEKLMEARIKEVGRSVHASNHYRIIDAARLLGVNLMNVHTPADNLVTSFLNKYLKVNQSDTVADLLKDLCEIPEYNEARMRGAGPKIFAGSPNHRVGKFLIEMTGGTSPSDKVYKELSDAGVSTIVGMHMKETSKEKADEHYMNVVVAGHMSSDSLGMNLFLDELEKKGIEVIPCSGLIRVSRNKKKK